MSTDDSISVEVVIALPHEQTLLELSLPAGSTVADALRESRLAERYRDLSIKTMTVGIWGKPCDRTTVLMDGARVELYRELQIDPRDARRQRALAGDTMRDVRASPKASGPS